MSSFETAALDPVFWLHHANVDRLWEVWLARDSGHANPADPDWGDAIGAVFEFHDENGHVVTALPKDFVDTSQQPMNYKYEDISDPLTPAAAAAGGGPIMPGPGPATLVAASDTNLSLGQSGMSADVPSVIGAAASLGDTDISDRRIYLNVENVTAERDGGSFEVLIGAKAAPDETYRLAGALVIFGARVRPAADGSMRSGITQIIDVTPDDDLQGFLQALREDQIEVRFRPLRAIAEAADIKVGRISFYVE